MDLDGRAFSMLINAHNSRGATGEVIRIVNTLLPLGRKQDHETPEMWASRIRDPFRKLLEESSILSKNGYVTMHGKLIDDAPPGYATNYIYCSVCDSLVFVPAFPYHDRTYRDSHLKRCISRKESGNTISDEHERINDILECINKIEFNAWQYKQMMLLEEAKLYRLRLELFSQSTSHSEKDKLASLTNDYVVDLQVSYEAYTQAKASNGYEIKPEDCLLKQTWDNECFKTNKHIEAKLKRDTELRLANQRKVTHQNTELSHKPVALMGGLERHPRQRSASVPEISSKTSLGDPAKSYFDSVRKNARR